MKNSKNMRVLKTAIQNLGIGKSFNDCVTKVTTFLVMDVGNSEMTRTPSTKIHALTRFRIGGYFC